MLTSRPWARLRGTCPCLHSNNHAAGETILLCRNENQNRTRTVVAAGTGATPAAFYLGLCRLRGTLSLPAPHDCDAGGLILSVATTNPAVIPKSGPEIKNRCSLWDGSGENHAVISNSGPEIKNRCTQESLNGEKLTSIPKSELEIKNRCTQQGIIA